MSAPSSSNNRFPRRTRIEDYYSDQEEPNFLPPKKGSPLRKGIIKKTPLHSHRPIYYNDMSSEEEEEYEEELQRAMSEFGLRERAYHPRRNSRRPEYYPSEEEEQYRNMYPWASHPMAEPLPPPPPPPPPPSYLQRSHSYRSSSGKIPRWSHQPMTNDLPFRPRRAFSIPYQQGHRSAARSVPSSPLQSSDEEEGEEGFRETFQRQPSLSRRMSDSAVRPPLNQNVSFQGYPPQPPAPPPPPHPAMFAAGHPPPPPPPPPPPRVDRNHPMYNGEFYEPEANAPMWPRPALHHSPPSFPPPLPPPMPMMPMMPVMQPPVWNFMPTREMWPGAPEFPLPQEAPNEEPKDEMPEPPKEPSIPEPAPPRVVLPEPKQRRSLFSMLFGGVNSDFSGKRELKKAQEYEKLGTFWCWRVISDSPRPMHFESFNLSNQKLIHRKINKGRGDNIFLNKEKKLPGVIMIDVNQSRGCCMAGEGHFLQLELKREQYNSGEGNQYVFDKTG